MTEPHEMHEANVSGRDTYGERLTPDQYEKAAPLLKLHDHGKPKEQHLTERMKPGELKRRELKRRAVEALREYGTIGHAATAAGVPPSTLYRWRQADPEFNDTVTEFLHVDLVDTLEQSAYQIATSTDPKMANAAVRAQEFLLKAYDPDRFTERIKQETTVTVNHQVQVVTSYRDKQRAALQSINQKAITIDEEKE